METPYRKVTFEIKHVDHEQTWLIGKSANFIFNPNTISGEELTDFLSGCEEIPDNSYQIEKLEADKVLYRKVAVSERFPQFAQRVIALVLEQNDLGLSKFLWNVSYSDITKSFKMDGNTVQIEYWLEEIPDNTTQLKADKAELLEALDNSLKVIEWYMENTMPENENHTDFFNIGMNQRTEIDSLIQKHKQ